MGSFSALAIGGVDSSGGAGITADMLSFSALGVHGTSVVTAVTAQNTKGIFGIYALKANEVARQVDAVLEDIDVRAVKTGMLVNEEIVEAVSRKLRGKENVVVDPVMLSGTGARLLSERGIEVMKEKLIPIAAIVTPNISEAERLSGVRVSSLESAKRAAKEIGESANAVLVKGGHLASKEDVLYYEGKFYVFQPSVRVGENVHGTGCSLSACIAAELAKGKELSDAVRNAKRIVERGIVMRLRVGKGAPVINPAMLRTGYPHQAVNEVENTLLLLSSIAGFEKLLPEVGSNIVMAKKNAKTSEDVAGISGRMRKGKDRIEFGSVCMGASRHMASALLEIVKHDSEKRALMNVRYDKRIVEACRKLGYDVRGVGRGEEPEEIRKKEGASIPWVARKAIGDGNVPDVVYHEGEFGKEPMMWVIGKDACDVKCKVIRVLGELGWMM